MKKAVVLIGHGGVPKDFPPEKIGLDHEIRSWPRTPENDPFYFGMRAIAAKLALKLPDTKLVLAFNEFCAPSIEQAVEMLITEGFDEIKLLTTMFTPGGVHSEFEIPKIIKTLQKKHPQACITYPWPFNLDHVATFLSAQVL